MNNVLQNMDNTNIYFNSLKRADWLRQIATIRNEYKKENYQKQITFVFKDTLSPELFQPIHVVTIACLIEFLVNVEEHTIRISNESIEKLLNLESIGITVKIMWILKVIIYLIYGV